MKFKPATLIPALLILAGLASVNGPVAAETTPEESPATITLPDTCGDLGYPDTVLQENFLVGENDTLAFELSTSIIARNVTIKGSMLGASSSNASTGGVGICIEAENLDIQGTLCGGNGFSQVAVVGAAGGGQYSGLPGTPGGSLHLLVEADAVSVAPGAVLCSGAGGQGQSVLAFERSLTPVGLCASQPGEPINLTGGAGGAAGDFVAVEATLASLQSGGARLVLGDGGHGGDAHVLFGSFAGGSGQGGAGGQSGYPGYPGGEFFAAGTGGDGGDSIVVPCPDVDASGPLPSVLDLFGSQQQIECGVNSPLSCWVALILTTACGENGDCVEDPCEGQDIQTCLLGDKECEPDEVGIPPYCAKVLELYDVRPCEGSDVGIVLDGTEYCFNANVCPGQTAVQCVSQVVDDICNFHLLNDCEPGECDDGETGVPPACVVSDPGECDDGETGSPPLCFNPGQCDSSGGDQGQVCAAWTMAFCILKSMGIAEEYCMAADTPFHVDTGVSIDGDCTGSTNEITEKKSASVSGSAGVGPFSMSASASKSWEGTVGVYWDYSCKFWYDATAFGSGGLHRRVRVVVEEVTMHYCNYEGYEIPQTDTAAECKAEPSEGFHTQSFGGVGDSGYVEPGELYPGSVELCWDKGWVVQGLNEPTYGVGSSVVKLADDPLCTEIGISYNPTSAESLLCSLDTMLPTDMLC